MTFIDLLCEKKNFSSTSFHFRDMDFFISFEAPNEDESNKNSPKIMGSVIRIKFRLCMYFIPVLFGNGENIL